MDLRNIRNIIAALLIILLFVSFFYLINFINERTVDIILADQLFIEAEIADSSMERSLGLSGRESLDRNRGMFFVLKRNTRPGFWMKDMNFDIDIIWIAGNEIAGIEHSIDHNNQTRFYYPPKPVNYVLEINAGIAKEADLKIGDRVQFQTETLFEFLTSYFR